MSVEPAIAAVPAVCAGPQRPARRRTRQWWIGEAVRQGVPQQVAEYLWQAYPLATPGVRKTRPVREVAAEQGWQVGDRLRSAKWNQSDPVIEGMYLGLGPGEVVLRAHGAVRRSVRTVPCDVQVVRDERDEMENEHDAAE